MNYDKDDHKQAIAFLKESADFYGQLLFEAECAKDETVKAAWLEAAASFDNWIQDELSNGVIGLLDRAEADAAPDEHGKEQRELTGWHHSRVL